MTAGERCGERLLREKEDLARAITDALYRERPDLAARYGAPGREKCLQDMRYNLEHLAPAVALAEPALFAGYSRWLASLLGSRGIPLDEIARSLVLTREAVASRFPAEEAAAAASALEAGLAALQEAAPPSP
jgi:MerR family transcriptional regulator, light-induced transcriptional regulator